MRLLLAVYLLYSSIRLFIESVYTYRNILICNNFGNLIGPILKFVMAMTMISIIYGILQLRWIYNGLYTELTDTDEVFWSLLEGSMLFVLANICSILRKLAKRTT